MKSVDETFAMALCAHQAGRAEEAAAVYERILSQRPDHAGSWHLLGLVYRERGDLKRAANHISRAIALDATKAVYHNNLGVVLRGGWGGASSKRRKPLAAWRWPSSRIMPTLGRTSASCSRIKAGI